MKQPVQNSSLTRRRFPRRAYAKSVAVLLGGQYTICSVVELGEGGLSFRFHEDLPPKAKLVANFQVPGGTYTSVRAVVMHSESNPMGDFFIGIEFIDLDFSDKRLIRSFVASRTI